MEAAPLISNSYSGFAASTPPEFIFKPFQFIVELLHGQKQKIKNKQRHLKFLNQVVDKLGNSKANNPGFSKSMLKTFSDGGCYYELE